MIGRGKHNDIFLYEITEQDLLIGGGSDVAYSVGNVLMFADKKAVVLGTEFAFADDLDAAKEFLDQKEKQEVASYKTRRIDKASLDLRSQIAEKDENLRSLTEKIEQRDELLRDISESLKSQKQENELLHLQLTQAREQLVVDELVRSELVDDLQNVSKDTHTIESTLEHVLEEKYNLEQELAEKITDLVELNLQNDDLRKQLSNPMKASLSQSNSLNRVKAPLMDMPAVADTPAVALVSDSTPNMKTKAYSETQVLTMSSGKRIHVLHEFPENIRSGLLAGIRHVLFSFTKIFAVAVVSIALLMVVSVIATAGTNGISHGNALDLILRQLGLPT
jgi:regulator of replication initiation timing